LKSGQQIQQTERIAGICLLFNPLTGPQNPNSDNVLSFSKYQSHVAGAKRTANMLFSPLASLSFKVLILFFGDCKTSDTNYIGVNGHKVVSSYC
jgi:hypothetical protein